MVQQKIIFVGLLIESNTDEAENGETNEECNKAKRRNNDEKTDSDWYKITEKEPHTEYTYMP